MEMRCQIQPSKPLVQQKLIHDISDDINRFPWLPFMGVLSLQSYVVNYQLVTWPLSRLKSSPITRSRCILFLVLYVLFFDCPITWVLDIQGPYWHHSLQFRIDPPRLAANMMTTFLFWLGRPSSLNPHKYDITTNNATIRIIRQNELLTAVLGQPREGMYSLILVCLGGGGGVGAARCVHHRPDGPAQCLQIVSIQVRRKFSIWLYDGSETIKSNAMRLEEREKPTDLSTEKNKFKWVTKWERASL